MQNHGKTRRPRGSGCIIVEAGSYHGKWWVQGKQVKRKLGPVRKPGTRNGLTRPQAEALLHRRMSETAAPVAVRLTVAEVADRLLDHLQAMGRKPSTIRSYRSNLRIHIGPRLGDRQITRVEREDLELFRDLLLHDGLAPKSVAHVLGLLHSVFGFAIRRGWATGENPCRYVERPKAVRDSLDIRFLEPDEVEALLRAVPDGEYGGVYRALYLAAAMTGARQGELLALRWRDVDWVARRVRIRRTLVRGEFGTPKSGRGRSVPLADRLGGELDRLFKTSKFQADEALVFGNPRTGDPMHGHAVLKSYQRALERAGVRKVRFHDLRHTFGTRMAAAGVPMRTIQEFMGHSDIKTTMIYADYSPSAGEVDLVNSAFRVTTDAPDAPVPNEVPNRA